MLSRSSFKRRGQIRPQPASVRCSVAPSESTPRRESQPNHPSSGAAISSTADSVCITTQSILLRPFHGLLNSSGEPTCIERNHVQFGQIGHYEQIFPGGNMLDTDRAAHLTDKLLDVIMPELNREPRTQDNVWCVIDRLRRRRIDQGAGRAALLRSRARQLQPRLSQRQTVTTRRISRPRIARSPTTHPGTGSYRGSGK